MVFIYVSLTLSAIGGVAFSAPPLGKTAITTHKSNHTELKKFGFSKFNIMFLKIKKFFDQSDFG